MTAKNIAQRVEMMEELVGAVQELYWEVRNLKELQHMNKRLDTLIKFQEDSARIASASSGKAKEYVLLNPLVGDTYGASGTTLFSGSH